jgi:hypothetical protein
MWTSRALRPRHEYNPPDRIQQRIERAPMLISNPGGRIGSGRAFVPIQKTRPQAYRAEVLERALLSARSDVNRFWMLLSGNAEVAFPSTTATTTVVASLPTPAAPVNAAAVAATGRAADGVVAPDVVRSARRVQNPKHGVIHC